MAKIDEISEAIEALEDKANKDYQLAIDYLDSHREEAYSYYSKKTEKWQRIVAWLKEYREILQEREDKQ